MGIRVDFACNDEHGHFTGKAERVSIGDLELECTLIGGGVQMKLYEQGRNMLKVGRVILKFGHYRYGVGNWCWDGYTFLEEDVLRIVHYLQRQKYWTCEEGPSEQFDKFNNKTPFTLADLKECV